MPTVNRDTIVIAGAGMTGMMTALLLKRHHPGKHVIVIESATHGGGNYRPVTYKDGGSFDQGMRMLYETGIAELDGLLHGLLPDSEWHILPGNLKDIAGLFWNNRLQTNSQYIDLRTLNVRELQQCTDEVLARVHAPLPPDNANAQAYLVSRFGPSVAGYLSAALEKLFAQPAHMLDMAATRQPSMDRVILMSSEEVKNGWLDEEFRARIAWPDQLTLPPVRAFNQSALYPKRFGMQHVIDSLTLRLALEGIECIFGDSINHLIYDSKCINEVHTTHGRRIGNISSLFWTAGLPRLAMLLNAMPANIRPPRREDTILVHACVPYMPNMGQLYHLYCYEPGFHTFRVTNYTGYCPAAMQPEGAPLCLELWHLEADDEKVKLIAGSELQRLGIIRNRHDAIIKGMSRTANLHASYSLSAMSGMRQIRDAVAGRRLANLEMLGVHTDNQNLLLYEIWRDMHAKVTRL
jgi:protoporphyrinogen oxidase